MALPSEQPNATLETAVNTEVLSGGCYYYQAAEK